MESSALQALLTLLHPDPVEAADAYRRLQLRLVRFFNLTAASDPQHLADETLGRLARRAVEMMTVVPTDQANDSPFTEDEQPISHSSAALVFSTARQVLQEDLSRSQPNDKQVREWLARTTNAPDTNHEVRQANLQSCLSHFSPERRRLLEKYYGWSPSHKAEHHLQLAQSLGLSLDALRNRVLRSRLQLESCIRRKRADSSRRSRTKGRRR